MVFVSEDVGFFQSQPGVGIGFRFIWVKWRVEMSFGLLEPAERPNLPKLRMLKEAFSEDLREDLRSEYQL